MFAFCVCSPAASDAMLHDDTARRALPGGMQSTAQNTFHQQRRESHCHFLQLHALTARRDQHQVGCCQSAKRRPECLTAPLLRLHAASKSAVRVAGASGFAVISTLGARVSADISTWAHLAELMRAVRAVHRHLSSRSYRFITQPARRHAGMKLIVHEDHAGQLPNWTGSGKVSGCDASCPPRYQRTKRSGWGSFAASALPSPRYRGTAVVWAFRLLECRCWF